jgi:4,5:9,10-diseco-3-hydroxy-5,9,17-trioxoandrosta-1(10),2-diene-4-oate hydrolase
MRVMPEQPLARTPTPPNAPSISDEPLTLHGLPVRVLRGGSGPHVVCLHGYSCTADMWRPNLPALVEAGYAALAFDLPGHGETFRPRRHFTISDMARWLSDCLDALGIERAHVIANSLGGAVASEFALAHPERVERLVLVDAFALDWKKMIGFLHNRRFWRGIFYPSAFEMLFGKRPWIRQRQFEVVVRRPERLPPRTLVLDYPGGWVRNYWGRALVGMGVLWELPTPGRRRAFIRRRAQIRAPTLIVWGEDDQILPVAHAHHGHALIPHSRLRVFPECGHVPNVEYPAEFNRLVLEFLAS